MNSLFQLVSALGAPKILHTTPDRAWPAGSAWMAWSVRRCSTIPDQFHRPVKRGREEFALVPGSPFQFCPRYNHVSEIPMVQVKVDGSSGEHRSTKSPGIHLFPAQDAQDSRSWLPPTPSSKGEGLARRAFATPMMGFRVQGSGFRV